jgi:hypothetical protein
VIYINTVPHHITFWSLAFSYWIDKHWLLTEGKFATMLIIPSSWGSQLDSDLHQHCAASSKVLPHPKLRESSTDEVNVEEGALEVLAAHGQAE